MKSTNPLNTDFAGTKGREGLVVPSKLALGAAAGSLEVRGKPPVTVRGARETIYQPPSPTMVWVAAEAHVGRNRARSRMATSHVLGFVHMCPPIEAIQTPLAG
jgi:hypothetical protein